LPDSDGRVAAPAAGRRRAVEKSIVIPSTGRSRGRAGDASGSGDSAARTWKNSPRRL
jgi:hypothetical protein